MNTNLDMNKKVKVSEIAAVAGVSPATVSRVINQREIVKGETYEKVIQAMKQLGCSINESPIPQPASTGLILINIPSLNNPFYGAIIKGARASISRHGYSMLINEGHINPGTIDLLVKTLKQNKVIGLITMNCIETSLIKKLSDTTCVVQCCEYNEDTDLPYVSINDVASAKMAVEHLLAQGKKRIAFINGPFRYKYAKHRLQGYMQALEEAGVPVDQEYIVQLPEIDSDLATSTALQLLNLSEPPDAFFTVSDVYGAAVLRACYLSKRRVPEQVAVVGFDNLEISKSLVPALSTVNQPKSQLGFMAAETLFEKITNPAIPNKKILLDTELIVRESSSL